MTDSQWSPTLDGLIVSRRWGVAVAIAAFVTSCHSSQSTAQDAKPAAATPPSIDFVTRIAPLFESRCLRCHLSEKSGGDLSLVDAKGLLAAGHVVPGKPDESPLLDVLRSAADGGPPAMPKEGTPLSNEDFDAVRQWIAEGAQWPADLNLALRAKADKSWWSLRPLPSKIAPPSLSPDVPAAWKVNPIDRFVAAGLPKRTAVSPPADKRTLLRRITYDLIGLPPTPAELDAFVKDDAPDAYDRVVDRLLVSPRYGERWGRHWLDVVRFGESNGFERNVLINNAWPFRDYVIRSFNDDKPFDRLVAEHLAGDALAPDDPLVAVGTTFLVCGPYDNVGNQDAAQALQIRANTLDDMIRATSETFLGLTVGCARCHDHKFDPIETADYYRMYATFAGVTHGERPLASADQIAARDRELATLKTNRNRIVSERKTLEEAVVARAESNTDLAKKEYPRPAVSRQLTEDRFTTALAKQVRLTVTCRDDDATSANDFRIDEFEVWSADDPARNVALASSGAKAVGESRPIDDFQGAYDARQAIDGDIGTRWLARGSVLTVTLPHDFRIDRISFSSDRAAALKAGHNLGRFVGEYVLEISLDGTTWSEVAGSKDRKPVSPAHRRRRLFEAGMNAEERKTLAESQKTIAAIDKQIAAVPPLPTAWVGRFSVASGPFNVFVGGDPQKKGPEVVAAGLRVVSETTAGYELPGDASEQARRLRLAQWLVAVDNPLTPRVLANRLWHYHFGVGLVDTPSDFGYMGSKPSHPELLDFLARQLVEGGWRLKPMHRLIVLSQTYRQASTYRADAASVDADSRTLWRYPPRRLSAEEIRDSMLAASGKLDTRMGGPGFRLYKYLEDNVATYVPLDEVGPDTYRRSVYHQQARAARVDVLTDFDCPDNAFGAPRRASTTTPLQALTMLNHRFTLDMAAALAERLVREAGPSVAEQVDVAFRLTFGRPAMSNESKMAVDLIERHGLRAFCRAMFNANEFVYVH